MSFLFNVILTAQMLSALGVIGLVLVQHGKGADMGAAFGSGTSGSLFGATGSANFLSRATAVLATVFFASTLALAYLGTHRPSDSGSVLESHINPLMLRLRDVPFPWVSAVKGSAAGVGCSFALAADIVVCGESAFFLQAFARIGLVPDGGSSWILANSIGRARAMEMMLLGERIPAAKALEWGMINRLVPDEQLMPAALDLAKALAAGPTQALGMIRRMAWSAANASFEDAMKTERNNQRLAGQTKDHREGVTAFLAKRPAQFTGL
jgi:2-(1,2-epoxy-1,2-dihydrophenyl)acetyl-CoA isomerase